MLTRYSLMADSAEAGWRRCARANWKHCNMSAAGAMKRGDAGKSGLAYGAGGCVTAAKVAEIQQVSLR